jgi:perosamine synthetase
MGAEEVRAAEEVILSGWVSQGPKVMEFEKAVATYVGARYGVDTNSCTSALHLAIHLAGIGSGDDVIVPSFTCMATANAVHHAGAQPVFADIDRRTYNLDPESAAAALTPRTKAILVVHQIGLVADMQAFQALARRKGLILIEDGACSLGAAYHDKRVGAIAGPTCFSFHPRKMITTGEGGMLMTEDADLANKARVLRATGASISDLERHKAKGILIQKYESVGYNYRMTDIQAAIGLVQMTKLPDMLRERTAQARRYDLAFQDVEEIEIPYVPPKLTHAYTSYLVRLTKKSRIGRDTLLHEMAARGISCRAGIQPLHREPFYANDYTAQQFPESDLAAADTIFLPIFPGLTEDQQRQVTTTLISLVRNGG